MLENTETRFQKAYDMVCNTEMRFAPDVMLKFYALYKRATEKNGFFIPPGDEGDLRSAFKVNALLQVKDISRQQAKQEYIELVEEHIGEVN
jgi:acyl-CoA-binding protein